MHSSWLFIYLRRRFYTASLWYFIHASMTHGMTHIYFRELSCVKEGVLNPWVGLSISSFGGGGFLFLPIPLPPATHSGFSGLHVCLTFLYLCYYAFLPIVALWWAYRVWVGSAREARSWRGEGGGSSWVERDWRSCLNFYCFSYCRYNPLIVLYLE